MQVQLCFYVMLSLVSALLFSSQVSANLHDKVYLVHSFPCVLIYHRMTQTSKAGIFILLSPTAISEIVIARLPRRISILSALSQAFLQRMKREVVASALSALTEPQNNCQKIFLKCVIG